MTKVSTMAILLAFSLTGHSLSMSEFPITVTCQNTDGAQLTIGASPAKNSAMLDYKNKKGANPVVIKIGNARNMYTSSTVSITSGSSGEHQNLILFAHMEENLRLTRFANFAIDFMMNEDGQLAPDTLTFQSGISTTPNDQPKDVVDLKGFTCSVTGL